MRVRKHINSDGVAVYIITMEDGLCMFIEDIESLDKKIAEKRQLLNFLEEVKTKINEA